MTSSNGRNPDHLQGADQFIGIPEPSARPPWLITPDPDGSPGRHQQNPPSTAAGDAEHAAVQQNWFSPGLSPTPGGRTGRWNAASPAPAPQQQPPTEVTQYRPSPNGYPSPAPAVPEQPSPPQLDDVEMLHQAQRAPRRGWRRAVHRVSGGAINPGDSADDIATDLLKERVNQSVRGDYRIAVVSLKGGVGKTTTAIGLGSTFASVRGDRVIAVDANPDLGTLAQRVPRQTASTVRDLIADRQIQTYSDVRMHTSQASSRLEILASERDPATSEAFNDVEYRQVLSILQRYYNIIITDCGTGMSHSAMNGVLDLANAIILVSSPAMDAARSAGATLDWLQAHGHGHLVSRAVVVLSSSRPGASSLNIDQLTQYFLSRCRAVQQVPFDDHLAQGAEVDIGLWSHATGQAFLELAAVVADDFPATTMKRNAPFYY